MTYLTTKQAAVRLGIGESTARLWCKRGRFPGAFEQQTLRGPVWQIPEVDVTDFKKPQRGRPSKKQSAAVESEEKAA
jgi:predicted site-specific integrase-resolvase